MGSAAPDQVVTRPTRDRTVPGRGRPVGRAQVAYRWDLTKVRYAAGSMLSLARAVVTQSQQSVAFGSMTWASGP